MHVTCKPIIRDKRTRKGDGMMHIHCPFMVSFRKVRIKHQKLTEVSSSKPLRSASFLWIEDHERANREDGSSVFPRWLERACPFPAVEPGPKWVFNHSWKHAACRRIPIPNSRTRHSSYLYNKRAVMAFFVIEVSCFHWMIVCISRVECPSYFRAYAVGKS